MDLKLKQRIEKLYFSNKKYYQVIIAVLLISNLSLIALSFRGETMVLVPLNFQTEIKVGRNTISEEYLEKMSIFYTKTLMDQSPDSFGFTAEFLKKFLSPETRNNILYQFAEREIKYKNDYLSTYFIPSVVEIDTDNISGKVRGRLVTLVGKEEMSDEEQTYNLKFKLNNGMLMLSSFLKEEINEK